VAGILLSVVVRTRGKKNSSKIFQKVARELSISRSNDYGKRFQPVLSRTDGIYQRHQKAKIITRSISIYRHRQVGYHTSTLRKSVTFDTVFSKQSTTKKRDIKSAQGKITPVIFYRPGSILRASL
jgi:hypothetical protein